MKRSVRALLLLLCFATIIMSIGITVFAEDQLQKQGWVYDVEKDADGNEIQKERYYVNGVPYSDGVHKIGAYEYVFASDGECLGLYDGFKNSLGTSGVMDTQEFKDAVAAISPIEAITFDAGTSYGNSGTSINQTIPEGGIKKSYAASGMKFFSSKFLTVFREAEFGIQPKNGSDTNLAYVLGHASEKDFDTTVSSKHTYVDRGGIPASAYNTGLVIDFEIMLNELPSSAVSLVSVADRAQKSDPAENGYTGLDSMGILSCTTGGFIYSHKAPEYLLASLNTGEFVRVSISIDNKNNKFDIYINGVLALSNITLYTNNKQALNEFKIEEVRMFEISSSVPNSVEYVIDNFYIYQASEPVCIETVENSARKNGINVDGSFIRNYVNGIVSTASTTISGDYFGNTYNNHSVKIDSTNGAAFIGYKVTVTKDGKTVSSTAASDTLYVTPGPTSLNGKKFVAWNVKSGDTSSIYTAESKLRIDANITVDALGIGISMLDGASVKTVANSSALRFMAKITKADYDALTELGMKIEPHIMIVPTSSVQNAHGYLTYEHLAVAGSEQPLDIIADGWYSSNSSYYYYTATIDNIEDPLKEYSGITYLKITLPDGTVTNVYGEYSEKVNSRCINYVADKAYNDRASKKDSKNYENKTVFNGEATYSPYATSALMHVKTLIDRTVTITTDENGIRVGGMYYTAPYTMTVNNEENGIYNVTIGDEGYWSEDNLPVILTDGKLLNQSDYTFENGTLTFDVDSGWTILSPENPNRELIWSIISTEDDEGNNFDRVLTLPTTEFEYVVPVCPSGATAAFEWFPILDSGKANTAYLNKSEYFQSVAYTTSGGDKYYDLTDIVNISFWVYVPEKTVGATFYLVLNSENPNSDGSDYYSRKYVFSEPGWIKIDINLDKLSVSRSPLGFDKINAITFSPTGWEQTNYPNTPFYFTEFIADNSMIGADLNIAKEITKDGGAVFANGGYKAMVDGKEIIINRSNTQTVSFKSGDTWYLPVNAFAAAKDSEAYYYGSAQSIYFLWGDNDYTFKAGNSYYMFNGKQMPLEEPIISKNGGIYITLKDAMNIFGYERYYEDCMGLLVLTNKEDVLKDVMQNAVYKLLQELIYVRPSGDEVYNDIEAFSKFKHPYLMIDEKRWEELKYYYQHEELLRTYVASLETTYGIKSKNFTTEPQKFSRYDGMRMSANSETLLIHWALLYKLYDGYTEAQRAQLLDRIWTEVDAVCNYYDEENQQYSWNPSHFLDTSMTTRGIAIAYDWLYDEWTPVQRTVMASSIYELGLVQTSSIPGGAGYNLGGATNNWNGVCNGGIMAGALAIVNDEWIISNGYQDEVIKVINDSVKGIENGMWVYAPDGGYEEGPGYWSYGSTYIHIWISCLETACGTNYGIYYSPGFERSVLFTTYLGNGKTTWGFHDGGSGNATPAFASWFAYMSGNSAYNTIKRFAHTNGWTSSISIYDVLWFDPHNVDYTLELELDAYYSLDTIMTFRSSWDTNSNIFAGLHGGDNQASHGDLDIGNFVIDVNGTYMICDLGSENYNTLGYFGGYRWSYYNKRTEGQNTLVMLNSGESWVGKTGKPEYYLDANGNYTNNIALAEYLVSGGNKYKFVTNEATNKKNKGEFVGKVMNTTPDSMYYGQKANAVSKAVDFKSGENSAYGIVDMKPAYTNVASNATMYRGLYMTNNRSTVVIQDEGVFGTNQDIWWFAHTQGNITILEGGKSAYIYRSGIYLYAEIVEDPNAPLNATFTQMAAESLDSEYVGDKAESGVYTGEVEKSRDNYKKLCIAVENTGTYNIAVAFTVINSPSELPALGTIYAWTPMENWTVD